MRTPESFGGISVLYRGHRRGSGGPLGGATPPGGATWAVWEREPAPSGLACPLPLAHEAPQHLPGLLKHLSVMLIITWYLRNTSGLQNPSSNISIFTSGPFWDSS